jgi:transcriptional regulator with XRE-family HTH domain
MIDSHTTGGLIRYVRESKGIKRYWLAEQLKIDETTLGKIENNQINITFKRLVEISQILEVNICMFIEKKHLEYQLDQIQQIPGESQLEFADLLKRQKSMLVDQMKVILDQNQLLLNVLKETNLLNRQLVTFVNDFQRK